MTRTVTRRSTAVLSTNSRTNKLKQWLLLKHEVDTRTKDLNKIRDELMAAAEAEGQPDEKGSLYLDVKPFEFRGKTYGAIKRTRRTSVSISEDLALKLVAKKGLEKRAIVQVPTLDQNELYVLNQEGKITDAELDSLFVETVTWAFDKVSE